MVDKLAKWKGRSYILKDLFREFFSSITSDILGVNKVEELHIDVAYSKNDQKSVAVKLFVTKYQLYKLNETENFMKPDLLREKLRKRIGDRLPKCAYYGFWVTHVTTPHVKTYPGRTMQL